MNIVQNNNTCFLHAPRTHYMLQGERSRVGPDRNALVLRTSHGVCDGFKRRSRKCRIKRVRSSFASPNIIIYRSGQGVTDSLKNRSPNLAPENCSRVWSMYITKTHSVQISSKKCAQFSGDSFGQFFPQGIRYTVQHSCRGCRGIWLMNHSRLE